MSTFIIFGKYTPEVTKAISAGRTAQAEKLIEMCGGKLIGLYATMGVYDVVGVVEFPTTTDAMKASVALNRATGISFWTTPAMTIQEFDAVCAL